MAADDLRDHDRAALSAAVSASRAPPARHGDRVRTGAPAQSRSASAARHELTRRRQARAPGGAPLLILRILRGPGCSPGGPRCLPIPRCGPRGRGERPWEDSRSGQRRVNSRRCIDLSRISTRVPKRLPLSHRSGLTTSTIVVSLIQAAVVGLTRNWNPVSIVDATTVARRRAEWKRARNFNPTALFLRDHPYFLGHLGQVLILTENHGDVVRSLVSHPDHVQRDTNVDSLQRGKCASTHPAAGQSDSDSVRGASPNQLPATASASALGESSDVVVWVGVAESLAGGVEEILPVHEGDSTLVRGLRRQERKK